MRFKYNCSGCHFLAKEHREETTGRALSFSLNIEERRKLKTDPLSFQNSQFSLKCHMGVWDEGVSSVAKEDSTWLILDRKNGCFFVEYKQSMLFSAAVELQKRAQENLNLKKSLKFTVIGLWVAALGLLLNFTASIINILANH